MLKQIISISALTAASAICANAEEMLIPTIAWEDFSSLSVTNGDNYNDSKTSAIKLFSNHLPELGETLKFDGVDDVVFVRGAPETSGSQNLGYASGVGTFSVTFSSLVLPTGREGVLFSVGLGNGRQIGVGVDTTGKIITTTGSNGAKYSETNKTLTEEMLKKKNTLSIVLSNTTGASIYLNGESLGTFSGLKYTNPNESVLQLAVGATTIPEKAAQFTLENVYIHDTSLTAEQVKATFNAGGVIPEPSLFGLLAGLGALALVGTRRRRK